MKDIYLIKVGLVEKKKPEKWLAVQLDKAPLIVSKWCSFVSQPDLSSLTKIADFRILVDGI